MEISLVLIVLGILVGVFFSGAIGLAMILIGIVLLIWPYVTSRR